MTRRAIASYSYDCWLAFELAFVYFFVIETRNHTLEETAMYVRASPVLVIY